MTDTEIRLDWDAALGYCERENTLISGKIGWGFYPQDLLVLCCLHEAGKHRRVIEDLLEDCNFHTECGLLADGKYDECKKVILEDDEEIPLF